MKIIVILFLLTAVSVSAQDTVNVIWETDAKARTLVFSQDGLSLYSGGLEIENPYAYGNIKKWDIPSRTLLFTIYSAGPGILGLTNDLAVNPSGTYFASGHGSIYCVPPSGSCYNVVTGFYMLHANGGGTAFSQAAVDGIVTGVSFSRDGNYVAYGMRRTSNPQINVFRTSDFQLTNSFSVSNFGCYSVAFSTSQNILAAGMWEGHINLYNIETGQVITTLQHGNYTTGGYPVSLAFSPAGNLLASGSDGYNTVIKVWNTETLSLVRTFEGYYNSTADVAFSPNGEYLAAGFREYDFGGAGWRGLIKIWRISDGTLVKEYIDPTVTGNGAGVTSIAFSSAAENWFAYTYNGKIKFLETDLNFISGVPVELTTFTAAAVNNSAVLEWSTSSETNNWGFQIERASGDNLWESIGFVEGKGSTAEATHYKFNDNNPLDGKSFYRLKQIDFDGKFEYSGIAEVDLSPLKEFALSQNYPNPFNPSTKLKYSIPVAGIVQLKVYDNLGQEVAVLVNESKTPGVYEVEFNGSNLASGFYISRLTLGNLTVSRKLILSK
jgi:WD40 repeat protein